MALTDSDLMMIENLTYALSKSNPAYDYEKKAFKCLPNSRRIP